MTGKPKWIVIIGLLAVLVVAALAVAASMFAARIEPYARQAAIGYLSRRFESEVRLGALHIRLPDTSLLRQVLTRGRGATARIEGQDLLMRLKKADPMPSPSSRSGNSIAMLASNRFSTRQWSHRKSS